MTKGTAGTAAALAAGHWALLPAAPVALHSGTLGTWTGTEMLVWGPPGDSGEAPAGGGAALDPIAGTWRRLPPGPLDAREDAAAVWTGSYWWIWGGHAPASGTRVFDGATYTPATDSWSSLTPCPITDYEQVQAIVVGDRVVLTAQPAGGSSKPLTTAMYNITNGTWTAASPLPLPIGYDLLWLTLGATDDTGYLWSHYRAYQYAIDPQAISGSSRRTHYGVESYSLSTGSRSWVAVSMPTAGYGGIRKPLWTGADFLQPAAPSWMPHRHPRPRGLTGHRFDPSAGVATAIAHGPLDDFSPQFLWTGAALIAYDTRSGRISDAHTDYPGQCAVWDPVADTWATMPSPDVASSGETVAVWTGESLLFWGQFRDREIVDGSTPGAAGIGRQFIPAPG